MNGYMTGLTANEIHVAIMLFSLNVCGADDCMCCKKTYDNVRNKYHSLFGGEVSVEANERSDLLGNKIETLLRELATLGVDKEVLEQKLGYELTSRNGFKGCISGHEFVKLVAEIMDARDVEATRSQAK